MRLPTIALCAVLVGCTHTLTLFPRGGGEQATGTLNDGSRTMEVRLKGETYTGTYALGQSVGMALGSTYGARPVTGTGFMVAHSNNAAALLTSGKNVLRCEFVIVPAQGGNGVCLDKDGVVYDLLAK